MRTTLRLVAAAFAMAAAAVGAAPIASTLDYHLQGSTSSRDGGFDYVSVEPSSGRVFIGRSFGVDVLDRGRISTFLERPDVASVLQVGPHWLLTTHGKTDSATLVDRRNGRVLAAMPTGKSPDGAAYDAASGQAFVMNGGSEDISVIDVQKRRVVASIALGSAPEAAVVDGQGHLFVNLEEKNEIAVIDIGSRRVTGHLALAGCNEPTGLALDPVAGILASACHNGVLKFIDSRDGRDRGQLEIGQGADASLFDVERRIGFVPCLDGTLTIYRLDATGRVTSTQRLATRPGARTAAYDSRRDRLYVAVADVERDAAGRYLRARKNFQLLTIAPAP
jgi:YVTN family beta-propeller protein